MTRRDALAGLGLLFLVAPTLRLRCAEGAQLPGTPAPADVRAAIESTIRTAIARLEARDLNGVLLHVSEQYRTEDVTKAVLRQQLDALFSLYDALRVQFRVDMMTAVGDTAWIWSTGQLSGRLPGIGAWIPTFTWEQQPEAARRENGSWRLYGLQ